jgi:hypothetical protein
LGIANLSGIASPPSTKPMGYFKRCPRVIEVSNYQVIICRYTLLNYCGYPRDIGISTELKINIFFFKNAISPYLTV